MKLWNKIKNKIIHLCGGYTREELPQMKAIIKTEYPIEHLQFDYRYFINDTPRALIEKEMANEFAQAIIKHHLYESQTESSLESPGLAITRYSMHVARPKSNI